MSNTGGVGLSGGASGATPLGLMQQKNAVQAVSGAPLKLNKKNIKNENVNKYIKNGTGIPNLNIKNNNKVNNTNNRLKNYYKINNSVKNLNTEAKLKEIDPKTYSSKLFYGLFDKTGKVIEQLANIENNSNKYRAVKELSSKWNTLTGAFKGNVFDKFPESMRNNSYKNMPHGGFFKRKMGVYATNNIKAATFKKRFNNIKKKGNSILNNKFINTGNNSLPERGKVLILILIFINDFLKKHKNRYNRASKVFGAINRQKGELAKERGEAISTVSGFNNMVMNVVEAINKLVNVTEKGSASTNAPTPAPPAPAPAPPAPAPAPAPPAPKNSLN